jgi:hypothetical protein
VKSHKLFVCSSLICFWSCCSIEVSHLCLPSSCKEQNDFSIRFSITHRDYFFLLNPPSNHEHEPNESHHVEYRRRSTDRLMAAEWDVLAENTRHLSHQVTAPRTPPTPPDRPSRMGITVWSTPKDLNTQVLYIMPCANLCCCHFHCEVR